VMLAAVMMILGNLLADVLHLVADPRLREARETAAPKMKGGAAA
jgi:hypothetical protein